MKSLEQAVVKISQNAFWQRLAKRKYENLELIRLIEAFFRRKRGYVFKMPPPGTPVIALVSGGLDSTIAWGLLLGKYRLRVYPLFLHQGIGRTERQMAAVNYFSNYFKERFPSLFVPPAEFSTHFPPPEIEKELANPVTYLHPLRLLQGLNLQNKMVQNFSSYGMSYTYPLYGSLYATFLYNHQNLKICTIFNAVTVGDGTVIPSQTFTALRATLLMLCSSTADYRWQFASLAFEKEIGHWWEKSDLIRLGCQLKFPLEKTWSCYLGGRNQCGNRCLTCLSRREEFEKAGVTDRTVYASETFPLKKLIFKKYLPKARKTLTKLSLFLYTVYATIYRKRRG